MSRKDFRVIAEALNKTRPNVICRLQWRKDVLAVARALSLCNPAFDLDRFLTTCGVNDE